jgi:small subunit ribosomal protein S9
MSESKKVIVVEKPEVKKSGFHKSQAGTMVVGRRKSAIARVRIIPGTGKMIVNGVQADQFFRRKTLVMKAFAPIKYLQIDSQYDILVNLSGGGLAGAAGAVSMGLARALLEVNPENRLKLKPMGFLSRDARVKERKKYGRKKARKGFQYRKR